MATKFFMVYVELEDMIWRHGMLNMFALPDPLVSSPGR